jgi:hypothetical protein
VFVVAVTRMVLKDFTFADGTTVPAGTLVAAPMFAEHLDEIRADYDVHCFFIPLLVFHAGKLHGCAQV